MSLILNATFRYFYCSFSLNNNKLSFFEVQAIRPLSLFIELSTSLLLTFPYSVKILDSGLQSSLHHYSTLLCWVTLAFTKIIHVNTLASEFLNLLTSNIIFLHYISAKHYHGHMPWRTSYHITVLLLKILISSVPYSSDQSSLNFLSLPSQLSSINPFGAASY